MTYREIINSVLRRLREDTIDSDWSGDIYDSTLTPYQKLIGELVNDSKKGVESYHSWNSLRETFNIKTKNGNMQYTLGDALRGAGVSFVVLDVINQTTGTVLEQVPNDWMNEQVFPLVDAQSGEPTSYAFNGISQAGVSREPDFNIDFYPIPNSTQIISVNIEGAQKDLSTASQVLRVPSQPVILGAWARAVAERGEDGGTQYSAVAAEARDVLLQAIQIDAGNFEYERDWYAN
jgi:hypothetical protein|tara:strand:- start:191 stop:892 length:702 start_codon:yes stop_codon:yes gene_type:complete